MLANLASRLSFAIIAAVIALTGFSATALAVTVPSDTSVAAEGNILLGIKGSFNDASESKAALQKVNAIRAKKGLPAVKWSADVERGARIMAAEADVINADRRITRPADFAFNGIDCYFAGPVYFNMYIDLADAVEACYEDYPGAALFADKSVTYFACASFFQENGYNPALVLAYSHSTLPSSGAFSTVTDCTQVMEFEKTQVGTFKLSGKSQLNKGKTTTLSFSTTVSVMDNRDIIQKSTAYSINKIRWTSSNSSVASVNAYGKVTALRNGSTTITATDTKTGVIAAKKITVRVGKQKIKVSPRNKTLSHSSASKRTTFKIKVTGAKGKVTYKLSSAAKKAGFKVSKKGKVTVPKKWYGNASLTITAGQTKKYFATKKTVNMYRW